jgi:hypothetical protein
MNSKTTLLGIVLTVLGVAGLVYSAVEEIAGYAPRGLLFGAIVFSVIFFFSGLTRLRGAFERI